MTKQKDLIKKMYYSAWIKGFSDGIKEYSKHFQKKINSLLKWD